VAGISGWHALFVTVTGIGAGALAAAGTLTAAGKVITGTRAPTSRSPQR
jgi:hypothetical protein